MGDVFAESMRSVRLAPRTIQLYVGAIHRLDVWLRERSKRLDRVSLRDLLEYAETLPFTYSSRQTFVNAYKAYWRHHLHRDNPCPSESVRCPGKPRQVYRGLNGPEEARAVIRHARFVDGRAELACALLYFTALRCAEAATLLWSADQGEWLSVMGKGAQPRRPPIHPELREILDQHARRRNGSAYMLPSSRSGRHVATNTVLTWVKLAGAAAGLGRVTPHVLRYTAGGRMYAVTKDLRGTAEFLGHARSSLSVTMGYTYTHGEQMRALMQTL